MNSALADDPYGIGTGGSLVLLKSTLSVSFAEKDPEGYPSCLLRFDGIAAHPTGGFIRYTGAFGRTNKYPDFPYILMFGTSEIGGANMGVTPSRPYYGYIKTSQISARSKVGRRLELPPADVVIEFKEPFFLEHVFFSMLEQKKVTLVVAKTAGATEEILPPIDLTVVESSPTGSQVHSNAAVDAFRKCMHLENQPPQPGNEYKFFR